MYSWIQELQYYPDVSSLTPSLHTAVFCTSSSLREAQHPTWLTSHLRYQKRESIPSPKLRSNPQNWISLAVIESYDYSEATTMASGCKALMAELSHMPTSRHRLESVRWMGRGGSPSNIELLLPEQGECCWGSKINMHCRLQTLSLGQMTRAIVQWDQTNVNSVRQIKW